MFLLIGDDDDLDDNDDDYLIMTIFTPLVPSGGGYAASAGADASGLMTLIGKQVPVFISHIMMTNKEMRVFVTIQNGRTFQLQLEHLEALSDVAILFLILIMMSATTQVIITSPTLSPSSSPPLSITIRTIRAIRATSASASASPVTRLQATQRQRACWFL